MSNGLNHHNNHLKILVITPKERFRSRLVDLLNHFQVEVLEGAQLTDFLKDNHLKNCLLLLEAESAEPKKFYQ
ncbi:MAG: hypothetical protein ACPLRA_07175, partial [Candidatus Saccharicenans sp.]